MRTPDIFSPLTAGIPGGERDSRRDLPRSGLLRRDPLHNSYWKGKFWRGNIRAPTNYIVYLALRNTDWNETRHEFCAKSRRLFLDDWLPHQITSEKLRTF